MDIPDAIEVFVHGFSYTRSQTYPFQPEKIGSLWVMRDAPRKDNRYRSEEWVAFDFPADETDRFVREHARGRYSISVICSQDDAQPPLRDRFKTLGYRLRTTEAFMVHPLEQTGESDSPAVIERVQTDEQARQLAKASRSRALPPENFLLTSPLRQYLARLEGEVVGWVQSITVGKSTWCSNMHVSLPFRRRGIARAMLNQMLRDDKAIGAQNSVLLATHAGSNLYPWVGYIQIGTLLSFMPVK